VITFTVDRRAYLGVGLLTALLVATLQAQSGKEQYVRLTTPRIAPIAVADFTPPQKAAAEAAGVARPNGVFRTALRGEPELARRWWQWLNYVFQPEANRGATALSQYDKELLILRVNVLCHDDYVWGQHVPIAKRAGRSDADIKRIVKGPRASGWNANDQALMDAVEEAHTGWFISDATWKRLAAHYTESQLVDLVFVIGTYHTNAIYTNSLGIPLEQGFDGIPRQ
jgi:alkylhydroperoxidase family enzyme